MKSILLRAAVSLIVPGQLFISILLLFRGHNEPGGGFIGGLVAACAVVIYGLAFGMEKARQKMPLSPHALIGWGLLLGLGGGLGSFFMGLPYMTSLWGISIPTFIIGKLKLGTPVIFDTGVYLLVVGIVVTMVFALSGQEKEGQ